MNSNPSCFIEFIFERIPRGKIWILLSRYPCDTLKILWLFSLPKIVTVLFPDILSVLVSGWGSTPQSSSCTTTLPPITKNIQVRLTRYTGHCCRSRNELISDIFLWTPSHGRAKAGRPARIYIQQVCVDKGFSLEDLLESMDDREGWLEGVMDINTDGATWWWWWWWWIIRYCSTKKF